MKEKIASLLIIAIILSSSLAINAAGSSLTITTDKLYYTLGENVEMKGTAAPNTAVEIQVESTLETVFEKSVSVDASGAYHTTFKLPTDALPGKYVVTASSGGSTVKISFAVILTGARELAEGILSLVDKSRERVEEAFDELKEEGVEIPTGADESYQGGLADEQEAAQLAEGGNYSAAISRALKALQHFGVALHLANVAAHGEPGMPIVLERVEGLEVAIERAYRFLERINATAQRMAEDDTDVSKILDNLGKAKGHLDKATQLLGENNTKGALSELALARSILDLTNGLIHSSFKHLKLSRLWRFLEQVQSRVSSTMNRINQLKHGLGLGAFMSANAVLKNVEKRLLMIKARFNLTSIDDVLDELEDVIEDIDEGVGLLSETSTSAVLRWMGRLEARVQTIRAAAERLEKKGGNITLVDAELDAVESLLSQVMERLESNEASVVKALQETIEERLERVEGMLHGISPSYGYGKGIWHHGFWLGKWKGRWGNITP